MSRLYTVLGLVLLLVGCTRGPGETCGSSDQCAEGGSCLKGVCSGYACTADAVCGESQTCGRVAGSDVCVQSCDSDDDCLGEQRCTEVNEEIADTGGTANVCL